MKKTNIERFKKLMPLFKDQTALEGLLETKAIEILLSPYTTQFLSLNDISLPMLCGILPYALYIEEQKKHFKYRVSDKSYQFIWCFYEKKLMIPRSQPLLFLLLPM